jgi:two-component system phosphate regulon sensor histidine kinase PhoR
MLDARRKFLVGLALLLAAGTMLGWLYGRPAWGLLAAALLALVWQVRQMFIFERALRTGDFDPIRYRSEFWSQAFSRLTKLQNRGNKHKRRYRRLLKEVRKSTNAMPDGAIILNDKYEIVLCNPAAQALVGFDPRLDRGQRVDNILRDPAFGDHLESGTFEVGIEVASPIRDGDWLYCRIVPYGENQKLLLIRDVTDRVRVNKMRRDFVANASHELRSPLTVISGYLDALAAEPGIADEWQRPIMQMRAQAGRMTNIVSELIELSRLETAESAPIDADVDVIALIGTARKTFDDLEGGPAIRTRIETNARLRGSSSDIESVITNLLSNAVRHTPGDGTVTLTWAMDDGDALLSVEDTGEGISEDHIPRLTERFFRVDRGRSREEGGVGLGLAIVKYALSRHDGELEIESTVGKGSRFTCRFPAARVYEPAGLSTASAG